MWGSSSGYIGSSSDPSGSITNIAQYIEDYIDLVENIPNDIARHVSRLHEYNNRYYQLLDKLEKTWESITHCSNSILSNGGGGGNSSDQVNGGGNTSLASSFSSSLPSTTTTISSLTSSSSHSLSSSSSSITEIKSSTNIKNNHTSSSSSSTTAPSSLIIKSNSNFNISRETGAKSEKTSGNATDLLLNCTVESKKGLKAVVGLQKCLIEIQEISDEKLFIVQSILDQLDFKARQLDYDHRSVTIGSLANNLNGNSSKGLASLIGASSDTTNHVSDANGLINNVDSGGGGKGGGEITSTKDNLSSNGTSLSATVNNNCTSNTLSSKRSSSRRNLSNKQEISNGEITSNHKRGVKRGSGGVKGSNKDLKRNKSAKEVLNTSPPTLYEDTPIDPDEPTYCSCEQVSYGEMICCDNAQCPIEWFHFACVSLSTKPKGKWYCPNCRGDRSNIPKK